MIKFNYKQSIVGSAIALIIASSCCWLPVLLVGVGGTAGLLGFSEYLEKYSLLFMLTGVVLLIVGIFQLIKNQSKMKDENVILLSTINCPFCGFKKEEKMPTNACQFFYECENCNQLLKPKTGDCCVYCSYGSVACPPIQSDKNCCN